MPPSVSITGVCYKFGNPTTVGIDWLRFKRTIKYVLAVSQTNNKITYILLKRQSIVDINVTRSVFYES